MGLLEFCSLSIFTCRTTGLLPLTPCEIPRHIFTFERIEMCPEGVIASTGWRGNGRSGGGGGLRKDKHSQGGEGYFNSGDAGESETGSGSCVLEAGG